MEDLPTHLLQRVFFCKITPMHNPVLVHTYRGDIVDLCHRGAVAVCDPRGEMVFSHGDTEALSYARSSIKPLQALPLIESGAADHYQLGDVELSLACASHNGEVDHTRAVLTWLDKIGLDAQALECGAHPPLHRPSADLLVANGAAVGKVHNNCSGKHTAMLTVSRFLQENAQGYVQRDHPAQQRWFDVMSDLTGMDVSRMPWSNDGCGIPVVALPLSRVAMAFAKFASPESLSTGRAQAVDRIAGAIAKEPFMIAGTGRLCTELMAVSGRLVLAKTGANGYFAASIPERSLGVAIKIDDGTTTAAEVALLATLKQLKVLSTEQHRELHKRLFIPITNTLDVVVGQIKPAEIWDNC